MVSSSAQWPKFLESVKKTARLQTMTIPLSLASPMNPAVRPLTVLALRIPRNSAMFAPTQTRMQSAVLSRSGRRSWCRYHPQAEAAATASRKVLPRLKVMSCQPSGCGQRCRPASNTRIRSSIRMARVVRGNTGLFSSVEPAQKATMPAR